MTSRPLIIYTDGGARGNPGLAAIGAIINDGQRTIHRISKTIGLATNNQAEYQAVYTALLYAKSIKDHQVEVYCDSELVVNQLQGRYKIKNRELGQWFIKIHSLINHIGQVKFRAIPRTLNTQADQLVNQALDQQL